MINEKAIEALAQWFDNVTIDDVREAYGGCDTGYAKEKMMIINRSPFAWWASLDGTNRRRFAAVLRWRMIGVPVPPAAALANLEAGPSHWDQVSAGANTGEAPHE